MNSAAERMRASASLARDLRFRTIVDSVVHCAMLEHGPVNPDRATQEAHDIAIKVAALLLQQIYDGDAELMALRTQRDAYKHQLEESLRFGPAPIVISTKEGEPK